VTGLNAGTTYYFAIKTADEVPNWSTISTSFHRLRRPTPPPRQLANLTAVLPTCRHDPDLDGDR
jgi:hypothetical protein